MAKRPLAAAKDPHTAARPRRRIFSSSGSPQRSLFTAWKIDVFRFCFVFPLLRGLVYWTNEDPISV